MKYYAVIDTNVLVSAMLKWNSVPGNIMELVFSGTIVPLLNEQIVKEYRDVLSRPKFHFTEKIIGNVINEIDRLGLYLDAEITNVILPDPKRHRFLRNRYGETQNGRCISRHGQHQTFSFRTVYCHTERDDDNDCK